jgi:hypothetical protein
MFGLFQPSPEQRRIVGAEAQQALENRHWKEAFTAVEAYVIEKVRGCKDKDQAMQAAITLQLLDALKRELVRKIEDGEVAKVEISQLEQRSALRVFRR